jgi:hypothetical protein
MLIPETPKFVYKDLGMSRIRKEIELLGKGYVLVGWPGDGPTHREVTHTTSKSGRTRAKKGAHTSIPVAAIALVHEFGSPANNIPERPVMRKTNRAYSRALAFAMARVVRQIYAGKLLPSMALKQLGVFWEGRIKTTFREGFFAPLKPATIARKGSSKPLIDSGQLRQSVTSRVVGL